MTAERVRFRYRDGTMWVDCPHDLAVLMQSRGEGGIVR